MISTIKSCAVPSIASGSRYILGARLISTSRIISTAANPNVDASDASHFHTFKEYRVFAQQFGPLASTAWAQNITKEASNTGGSTSNNYSAKEKTTENSLNSNPAQNRAD